MAKEVAAYRPPQGQRLGGDLGETYDSQQAKEAEIELMRHGKCDIRETSESSNGFGGQKLGSGQASSEIASPEAMREARARAAQERLNKG